MEHFIFKSKVSLTSFGGCDMVVVSDGKVIGKILGITWERDEDEIRGNLVFTEVKELVGKMDIVINMLCIPTTDTQEHFEHKIEDVEFVLDAGRRTIHRPIPFKSSKGIKQTKHNIIK